MTPEHNYREVPDGMHFQNVESGEDIKNLSELALVGLEYATHVVRQSTVALSALNEDQTFRDYLSYVVLTRIVRFSSSCPDEVAHNCEALKLFHEMGLYINEKLQKSGNVVYKDMDFTNIETNRLIKEGLNMMNVDKWLDKLHENNKIDAIRRLGSQIVPDNPKPEVKQFSTFRLD